LPGPVLLEKIFPFPSYPNHFYIRRRLVPLEGRIAIVTDAGWDAVDAAALGEHVMAGRVSRETSTARGTNGAKAYGEVVWSWHPLLVSSRRRRVGPTGLGQTLIRRRRWQKEFVTGESSKETVKTIACGNAG